MLSCKVLTTHQERYSASYLKTLTRRHSDVTAIGGFEPETLQLLEPQFRGTIQILRINAYKEESPSH